MFGFPAGKGRVSGKRSGVREKVGCQGKSRWKKVGVRVVSGSFFSMPSARIGPVFISRPNPTLPFFGHTRKSSPSLQASTATSRWTWRPERISRNRLRLGPHPRPWKPVSSAALRFRYSIRKRGQRFLWNQLFLQFSGKLGENGGDLGKANVSPGIAADGGLFQHRDLRSTDAKLIEDGMPVQRLDGSGEGLGILLGQGGGVTSSGGGGGAAANPAQVRSEER